MEKRFIGPDELAQYLDLSVNTIYAWVSSGKVPFVKMGRLVKFELKEIDKWILRLQRDPRKEAM